LAFRIFVIDAGIAIVNDLGLTESMAARQLRRQTLITNKHRDDDKRYQLVGEPPAVFDAERLARTDSPIERSSAEPPLSNSTRQIRATSVLIVSPFLRAFRAAAVPVDKRPFVEFSSTTHTDRHRDKRSMDCDSPRHPQMCGFARCLTTLAPPRSRSSRALGSRKCKRNIEHQKTTA
jgi:hypothetical protein